MAVIDADLQHDETQLPKMLSLLQSDQAELVVGSRYIEGGSADSFNKQRAGASALATELAKKRAAGRDRRSHERLLHDSPRPFRATGAEAFGARLQDPARPRRDRARQLRAREIPYTFGARQHGESKLNSMVALDFLGLVLAKFTHDVVSLRFLLFAMVGGIGLVVHLTTLFIALQLFKAPFAEAQAAARSSP